jgi:hypothetical protein
MYRGPYNEKEFQITVKCSTDLKDKDDLVLMGTSPLVML